ncbi:hypothetical protein [Brotaphodocola sp.]|uniref:hypothetical protein n=1 Tax=Brotaphodocola sp. TaxID=3073577 RepID=UPI003D7EFB76
MAVVRCLNCMTEYEETLRGCPKCGWIRKDERAFGMELEAGSILNSRYILGTLRGESSNDFLYIGWDALFSRNVLIQEYFPKELVSRADDGSKVKVNHEEDVEVYQRGCERFEQCGQALLALDGMQGMVNVLAIPHANGTVYQILEYPGEVTLREILEERTFWNVQQAEKLLLKLAEPLLILHEKGIYHGQISVDCCYLTEDGGWQIGRFNNAQAYERKAYEKEELSEEELTESGKNADIFELAHLMGAVLCGLEEWETHSVDENLDLMEEHFPEYLVDALECALSEDPSLWPASLQDFLNQFLDEETTELLVQEEEKIRENVQWDRSQSIWEKLFR